MIPYAFYGLCIQIIVSVIGKFSINHWDSNIYGMNHPILRSYDISNMKIEKQINIYVFCIDAFILYLHLSKSRHRN